MEASKNEIEHGAGGAALTHGVTLHAVLIGLLRVRESVRLQ